MRPSLVNFLAVLSFSAESFSSPLYWGRQQEYVESVPYYGIPVRDIVQPSHMGFAQPAVVSHYASRRSDQNEESSTVKPAANFLTNSYSTMKSKFENLFTLYDAGKARMRSQRQLNPTTIPSTSAASAVETTTLQPVTPVMSFGDIFMNGIKAGFNFLDKTVPQIDVENSTYFEINETTTTFDQTTLEPRSLMEDKIDSKTQKQTLEEIIDDLKRALEVIQKKKVIETKPVVVTNKTSTEDIIKHISASVDYISKTKSNETKTMKIKEISTSLDILLNRIARSATDLLHKQNKTMKAKTIDPILLGKIVAYLNQAKTEALLEKLTGSGIEVGSKEVDVEVLIKKLKQTHQKQVDDDMNGIDADVSGDVEGVTDRPEITTTRIFDVTARQESESDEGGGNIVVNLLSSFLGSLSTPTGGVDVDAIVGLVSGLSVQRDDGTFDFSGLTELLQSFLGGDGDGGSDVGAFLGGLLGAVIQGSANPPGAKGAGNFAGNVLANLLPGLSGPAPPSSSEEMMNTNNNNNNNNKGHNGGGLDSGSFLAGLLTSMLGASSGSSSGSSGHSSGNGNSNGHDNGSAYGSANFLVKIKNGLVKSIISIITSVIGSSSGASSGGKH